MKRWVRGQHLSRFLVFVTGLLLIAVGTLELWTDSHRGWLQSLCHRIQHWLGQDLHAFERSFGYVKGPHEPDFLLIAVGVLIAITARHLGSLLAVTFFALLPWIWARRIRVRVTPDKLIVERRWWFNLTLQRDHSTQVDLASAETYFSPYSPSALEKSKFLIRPITHPPAIVEIVHRLKRYPLIFAKRQDRAEALAVSIQQALVDTNPALSGPNERT